MFKFVHIADSHLDSIIAGDRDKRDRILSAVERAFRGAVSLCIDEKCNALLISGDLFDAEHLTFKTELMLRESFERLGKKGIQVFYSMGNHDPASSKLRRPKLGDNVHIFDNETPEPVPITDADGNLIGVVIGVGYSTNHVEENLSKKFQPSGRDVDVPVVGMLHTSLDVGGGKAYAPCTADDLLKLQYDYWALGHIHKSAVYGQSRPVIFPGCTCGRNFGETGQKGAYLVTLNKKGAPSYGFRQLADITWHDIEADGFENAEDAGAMQKICADKIAETAQRSGTDLIRLTMKGQCLLYRYFDEEARTDLQESLAHITGAEVVLVNKLTSPINPADYAGDKHLLSIALNMASDLKQNKELKAEIMSTVEEHYKGLDGGTSPEYIDSLLDNIDQRLCEVMMKQED